MKFVMTQSICPEGIEKLKADTNGQVEIIAEDNPDPNNYLDDMKDADALIVRIAKCDAHAIENSPNLKVIGRTGVGYDSVDVKKATELGIPVVITGCQQPQRGRTRRGYDVRPLQEPLRGTGGDQEGQLGDPRCPQGL